MTSEQNNPINTHSAYYANPDNQKESAIRMTQEEWDRQIKNMRKHEKAIIQQHQTTNLHLQ